jgi:uncharacterized protein
VVTGLRRTDRHEPRGDHSVCSGRVWHVRKTPFRHAFDYRVRMLELDLDDLDTAFAGSRLWSVDGANLGSFRRRDHLDGSADLAGAARAAVTQRLGFRPEGSVHLLCHPRYLGYAFNPVTFYLFRSPPTARTRGFSHGSHSLDAILLEVSNTPWNDRHLYALDCRGSHGPWEFEVDKQFHVSPFMPMDMRYRFRFEVDAGHFRVIKENLQDGESVFVARMELHRAPLTAAVLARALRDFPPMTLRVIGAIYWQALRLWLRGAKYHPRPSRETAKAQDGRN